MPGAAVPGAVEALAPAPEVVVPEADADTVTPEAVAPQTDADTVAPEAAVPADADTVAPEVAVPQADADTVAHDAPAVPDAVVPAVVAPVMPSAQPADVDTVLPEPAAAAGFAQEAPPMPAAAAGVTVAPDAAAVNGAAGADTVAPDAAAARAAANTVVPNASGLDTVFPPAGAGPERQRSPLRSRPLAIGLAAGLVVIAGGVGLLLTRSSNGPSPSTAASYNFARHQYPDGLVIVRRWTLSGDPQLTETITASSATGKALAVPFDEPIPASIANPQTVVFNPAPSKILDGGRLVQWNLRVPASGSVVVGYQATVAASGGAEAQLNRWAAEFDALAVGPGIGTISPPAAELRSVRISPSSVRLAVGHTVQLTLSGELSDGKSAPATTLSTFTWVSADPAIATVSSSGKVTGKKAGTTRVTALQGPFSAVIGVTVTSSSKPGTSPAPGQQPTSAPPPPVTTGPPPPPPTTAPPPPPPTPTLTPSPLAANMVPATEDAVQGPAVRAATAQGSTHAHGSGSAATLMHALRIALLTVEFLGIF
jgi:Bacterial Ig-like domain (group 2)